MFLDSVHFYSSVVGKLVHEYMSFPTMKVASWVRSTQRELSVFHYCWSWILCHFKYVLLENYCFPTLIPIYFPCYFWNAPVQIWPKACCCGISEAPLQDLDWQWKWSRFDTHWWFLLRLGKSRAGSMARRASKRPARTVLQVGDTWRVNQHKVVVTLCQKLQFSCCTCIFFPQDWCSKVALHEKISSETRTRQYAVSLHATEVGAAATFHPSAAETLPCE